MRREKRRRDRLAAESGLLKEEQDRLGRELAQLDVTDMGCHTSDPQCKVEFQYFFRSFESFEEWTRLVIISKRFILRTIDWLIELLIAYPRTCMSRTILFFFHGSICQNLTALDMYNNTIICL